MVASIPSVSAVQAMLAARPRLTEDEIEARKAKVKALSEPQVKVTLSDEAKAALAADKQRFDLEIKKSDLHKAWSDKIHTMLEADPRAPQGGVYAEIRKDGKVIATINNDGSAGWPGTSFSHSVFDGEPKWGGTALAQHRLRALQKASGGEIVMARTAITDPFAQMANRETVMAPFRAEKQRLDEATYEIDKQLADRFGFPVPTPQTSLMEDPTGGDPPLGLTQDALDYLKAQFEDPDVKTALAGGGLQAPDSEQLTVEHALDALSRLNEDMKARFEDLSKGPNLYLALARQVEDPPKSDALAASPTVPSTPAPATQATHG